MKIVVNGPGAAGTAITWLLRDFGAKNITLCDEYGILYPSRDNMEWHKKELAETFNKEDIRGNLIDAVKGADVFIGVSKGNLLTTDMVKSMNKDAIIFAMQPDSRNLARRRETGGRKGCRHGAQRLPESGQ